MKFRHRAREIALQILYQFDLASHATGESLPSGQDLVSYLIRHYDHFAVPLELREFVGQLVVGTLSHVGSLDELLEKHASNWKVARMSSVDRSLLRMSAFEMKFHNEIAASIVIDEAIELAKQFGTAESPAFVNGVLDSIRGG